MPAKSTAVKASVDDAYTEALAKFAQRENITAIDIGHKYVDGAPTGALAIRFHVKEKKPKSALESAELFPEEIKGIPVDVIQGNYRASDLQPSAIESTQRTVRFAKLQPGISIAHTNVSAGTLGLIVKDKRSGKPAILSNWHVLCGEAAAIPGDAIVQPGPYDGGRAPRDTVATLERMMLDKDGDAAIALLTGTRPFDTPIMDIDVNVNAIGDPELGDEVVKSGRTTQVTRGRVDGKGRYFINYSVGRVGVDGFIIVPLNRSNPDNEEISMGGDSGSIWVKEGTRTAIGLHFAGETDADPADEHAIACYASSVFTRLDIEPFGAAPASETVKTSEALSRLSEQLGAAAAAGMLAAISPADMQQLATRIGNRLTDGGDAGTAYSQDAANAVSIGFAVGAVARMMEHGRETGGHIVEDGFPQLASAFLAGAIAGVRCLDQK